MTSPTPKTNAMLVCDYVITERGTNKKSLIGVFENIGAGTFPCTHFAMSIYIKLTDAQGAYQFRLELVQRLGRRVTGNHQYSRQALSGCDDKRHAPYGQIADRRKIPSQRAELGGREEKCLFSYIYFLVHAGQARGGFVDSLCHAFA